jgi:hypothetical protein
VRHPEAGHQPAAKTDQNPAHYPIALQPLHARSERFKTASRDLHPSRLTPRSSAAGMLPPAPPAAVPGAA